MIVTYKMFRGTFKSWEVLFQEATSFANLLSQDRLISISHSCDNNDGVVVVWFWGHPETNNQDKVGLLSHPPPPE
ncbi:hypothetical protein ACFL27_21160 [candidate division CSSED10-310 bacterium]|uniref:Uncharacterized protein n=1 Tax=candidate division CSSED10-310 bacterium TaxID=2855610 RepID=A0ABV6Z2P4_UNCC1